MTVRKAWIVWLCVVCLTCASATLVLSQPKADRTRPPKPGQPPALKLPPIQKQRLANGLAVWLIEQHEVPLAQVNLIVRAGGGADPFGKFGLGSMTAAMLDEGAGARSALDLADAIEFQGAQLTMTSSFDYSAVRLSVPAARLAEAVPIMSDVVLRPTFPGPELERLRSERLTRLLQARDDPASIVEIAFPRLVFGGTHRYGTPAAGSARALKALTLDDIRAFHQSYYRPEHSTLVVVGDVTSAGVAPVLERAFGGWKAQRGSPASATIPDAKPLAARRIYLVDKPGAAQSEIRIGGVGVARSTPDYVALEVLNTILGGAFTSRLNTNLREKHGYSYGAYSVFDARLARGPFFAAAGVQTDKTAEALGEFFNELAGMLEPISADELEKAKNFVSLGFPAEFETTSQLARKVEEQIVYGLPDGYFTTFVQEVRQITAADVQTAAARYLQPDKFAVVVVGDRTLIEAGVRALNLGPIEVLTIEQAVGP